MLSSHQDAEDAFQATFLVLVRKAASVLPRELVANCFTGWHVSTSGCPQGASQCRQSQRFSKIKLDPYRTLVRRFHCPQRASASCGFALMLRESGLRRLTPILASPGKNFVWPAIIKVERSQTGWG
jgi:hypothetical protein